jgi:hypothetical protein
VALFSPLILHGSDTLARQNAALLTRTIPDSRSISARKMSHIGL